MTMPPMPPAPPKKNAVQAFRENLDILREEGASDERIAQEIRRWARIIQNINEREAAQIPDNPAVVSGLETLQDVAAGFPGARMAQAGLRALTGDMDVEGAKREMAAEDLRGLEDSRVGRIARIGGRVVGAGPMMAGGAALAARTGMAPLPAALTGSVGTGAIAGAVDQALTGDPDVSLSERAQRTALGAGVGAVAGPVAQGIGRTVLAGRDLARALRAPSRGAVELRQVAERAANASRGYAQAEAEGRLTQGPLRVTGTPEVAPYTEDVLSSPSFRRQNPNPTPQRVLDETYKEIGDQSSRAQQGVVAQGQRGNQRVQIGTRRDLADAEVLKQDVMDEMDYFAPSYRPTVQEYAAASGVMDATKESADAMRGLVTGKWVPGSKLRTQSPEAFEQAIPAPGQAATPAQFTPREVAGAREGAYSGLKESLITPFANTEGGWNPLKLFGIGPDIARTYTAGRFLRPLDEAVAGKPLTRPQTLRDALLMAGVGVSP